MDQTIMETAFCSSHLTYRAIEDNDEYRKFLHTAIQADPVTFAQSDNRLFRPQTNETSNSMTSSTSSKALLGVMICLQSSNLDPSHQEQINKLEQAVEKHQSDDDLSGHAAQKETKPISIGFLCLSGSSPGTQQHRNSNLGIAIAKPYQGQGYGSEAINWALDWAFNFGGLHSVSLLCFSFNTRAERLYERLGFVREGRHRERVWFNRAWHDEIILSMLETDWEVLRKLDS
jgi:RimJ/RimL family protein N-acetyltransferase